MKFNKTLFIVITLAAVAFCSKVRADTATNSTSWPVARLHALEKTLNIPTGATLDVGVGGVYAPALKNVKASQNFGYMLVANYRADAGDILSYQIRVQHLNISKFEGDTWQPNGMITASKSFTFSSISITPLAELGAAFDANFDPYGITGAGLGISWRGFFILPAIERWVGPRNSFTTYNAVAGYRITF